MEISRDELKELVDYNPDTGVFKWKKRDKRWFKSLNSWSRWNNMYAGKKVGGIHNGKTGYQFIQVVLNNKHYKAHRLAWLYMTGETPPSQIDHIDHDGTNNRWANLRDGSEINPRNRSMRRNNKSGVTGVSWNRQCNKWVARARELSGSKAYRHLGLFDDIAEAARVIEDFRRDQGYDPEHGKSPAHYY